MALVSDIMTRRVVTLEPGSSLREAVEAFRSEEVSGAPVTKGGELVGVISVTDILEFQATNPGVPVSHPDEVEAGERDTPEPWREDDEEMPSTYFVDYWSDAGAEITSRFDRVDGPEWDLLEDHTVREVMTRGVVDIPPSAGIREAARRMLEAEVQRVLVLEGTTLQGIVTATDIVRAVAEEKV